jgi:hypothetical protein
VQYKIATISYAEPAYPEAALGLAQFSR